MKPGFVLHPRHLPDFHASLIPSAVPCFWVMSESPFTASYFCFMGSTMGELAGRWEKFREISVMGIWDMEHGVASALWEHGCRTRRPWEEITKRGKLWVRRTLSCLDSSISSRAQSWSYSWWCISACGSSSRILRCYKKPGKWQLISSHCEPMLTIAQVRKAIAERTWTFGNGSPGGVEKLGRLNSASLMQNTPKHRCKMGSLLKELIWTCVELQDALRYGLWFHI